MHKPPGGGSNWLLGGITNLREFGGGGIIWCQGGGALWVVVTTQYSLVTTERRGFGWAYGLIATIVTWLLLVGCAHQSCSLLRFWALARCGLMIYQFALLGCVSLCAVVYHYARHSFLRITTSMEYHEWTVFGATLYAPQGPSGKSWQQLTVQSPAEMDLIGNSCLHYATQHFR